MVDHVTCPLWEPYNFSKVGSFFFNGFGEISIFKLVQGDFTKKMLKGLT